MIIGPSLKRASVAAVQKLIKVKAPWQIDHSIFSPRKAESDAKAGWSSTASTGPTFVPTNRVCASV
jgi:hypothetical protein